MRRNLIIAKVLLVLFFSSVTGFGLGVVAQRGVDETTVQPEKNPDPFTPEDKRIIVPVMVVFSVIFFLGAFAFYELASLGMAKLLDLVIPETTTEELRPPTDRSLGLG